ncbi:MAG TPA: PASTA domain-containing protein [Acidimicrobiia bacterium]|nr:PASTA domain-containing protein [Acidimicrobiia bacterium]
MLRVFLSYRREDAAGYAGRLFDALVAKFRHDNVFMDIDTISPGSDFVDVIDEALEGCDVLLALIGPRWLSATGANGHRRLDNPEDFVRLEIEGALARGIRVIPLLVGGAEAPSSQELPESLAPLARRHAFDISDRRWPQDVAELVHVLERIEPKPKIEQRDRPRRGLKRRGVGKDVATTAAASNVAPPDPPEPEPLAVPVATQPTETVVAAEPTIVASPDVMEAHAVPDAPDAPKSDAPPGRRNSRRALVAALVTTVVVAGALVAFAASAHTTKKIPTVQPNTQIASLRVPNLVGKKSSSAQSTLQHDGLHAHVVGVTSKLPVGTVIGQSPKAGSASKQGSAVTIDVSSGPSAIAIPNVAGKNVLEGARILLAKGFKVATPVVTTSRLPAGIIVGTIPSGVAAKGATIVVLESQGPQHSPPPNTTAFVPPPTPPPTTAQRVTTTVTHALPPAITSVVFQGTQSAPVVIVNGRGFGTQPTPYPSNMNFCGGTEPGTGYDYGAMPGGTWPNGPWTLALIDVPGNWTAGRGDLAQGGGDCVGMKIQSWTSTRVEYVFGNGYGGPYILSTGQQYKLYLKGLVFTGYIQYS